MSLNPKPTETDFVKFTPKGGFQTIYDQQQLRDFLATIIKNELSYFSSMISKTNLGRIISIAAQEETEIQKAEKFLSLIRN